MKIFIIGLAAAIFSLNLYATDISFECPNSNAEIVALINAPNVYCGEAINIATQCAFGSSRDLEIVSAAKAVCLKEAGNLSREDQNLLAMMERRCNQAYENQAGTMYMSMNAFCHLQAVDFIRNVQPEEAN